MFLTPTYYRTDCTPGPLEASFAFVAAGLGALLEFPRTVESVYPSLEAKGVSGTTIRASLRR